MKEQEIVRKVNSGNIQGEILSGALPYNSFQKKIEQYLNSKL